LNGSGHRALWKNGIEHGDPSVANLMVSLEVNNGILNDWDLAQIRNPDLGHVGERTGTLPFMALDLLTREYWEGKIPRLYRHDLEGLIWILPWVFLQFKARGRVNQCLRAWQTGDYTICSKEKFYFLDYFYKPKEFSPLESWKTEWWLARSLLGWLQDQQHTREQLAREREPGDQADTELSDHAVWTSFLEKLTVYMSRGR
jgi:hypothetical protein